MRWARKTVSFGPHGEQKVMRSQGNAKLHAVRVEILKFSTFACPMNHKGFADMKVQLPVAYSARSRSMKIFFFRSALVTMSRWNRLLHKFAHAPVYFISTYKGEVYSKRRSFAPATRNSYGNMLRRCSPRLRPRSIVSTCTNSIVYIPLW